MSVKVNMAKIDITWPWWRIRLVNKWSYLKYRGRLAYQWMTGKTILRVEGERMKRLVIEKLENARSSPSMVHTITIRVPSPEVLEWFKNNCSARLEFTSTIDNAMVFVFWDRNEAMAFKMRWF